MATLLDHVVAASDMTAACDVGTTGERFGCNARSERERRACSLYLWLLGPTTQQLATNCPCRV